MISTFTAGQDEIARRVKQFQTNFKAYHAPDYKEAHARQELIDWLFMALGWDVRNERGAAPHRREVILEASQEVEGQAARKAPDYAFRFGAETLFYVEAKKPGVAIKTSASAAFQLRRYAWSARLSLSLLTDFEELAVYDGRVRPSDQDQASIARINYYTYDQYADVWRELWDVYSREAVERGSFDQYVQSSKGKRGTTPVDAEFLKEIEGWREVLARNLALRNAALSIDELNDAVQRTIDRIIFLRMAEDRGIEPYGRLQQLAQTSEVLRSTPAVKRSGAETCEVYHGLLDLCRQADAKYNSGLFDFSAKGDRLTPKLLIDDKVLKPILSDLYFPHPYEFSVMPAEILGNVYEQFLGKVIRLTPSHQAKVEEKPEVKKAGGVYYTPAYIVAYIVKQTVGKAIEGKNPKQLEDFRALDMACGSGSFLLGAYQYLLDYYLQWYIDHLDPSGFARSAALRGASQNPKGLQQIKGEWRLTVAEKKRILTAHIFGVDIDRQAVEVTKLSLLLKVLEGESDESLQLKLFDSERALPNLDANIKCGNSLIGPDYFADQLLPDAEEMKRVNPFDWQHEFPEAMKAGGFSVIVGNPPYIRIQVMKEWAPLEVEAYKQLYVSARTGNYDIYVVFVERALSLLNHDGRLGFILPHKFFNAQYGEPLRDLIAKGRYLSNVVHFGDQQVFAGVTTYTCLMFLDKAGRAACHFVKVDDLAAWRKTGAAIEGDIPADRITAAEWNFTVGSGAGLYEKLSTMPVKLGDISAKIFQGLVTSGDPIYLLDPLGNEQNGYVPVSSNATGKEYELETGVVWPLCKGSRDIRRYSAIPSKRVLFPYDARTSAETGKTVLIASRDFAQRFPKAWKYLNENYDVLRDREKGKMRHEAWYGYVYPKSVALFAKPKILTPSIAANASFTFDRKGELYFVGSGGGGGGGYGIILNDDCKMAYEYVLGLLNSKLLDSCLKQISSPFRGGYYAFNRQYIEQLPIRPIDFTNAADKAAHDRMVKLVDTMLQLHPRLAAAQAAHDRDLIQRQIDATDRQIDALVYQLYGLTEEEIKIVEGVNR